MARKKIDLNTKEVFSITRCHSRLDTKERKSLNSQGNEAYISVTQLFKEISINHFSTYPQNVCKLRSTLTDKYKNYFSQKKIWKKLFGTIAELKNICVIYNWLFYIYFITKIYYYFFAYALLSSFSFQNGCLANIIFDLCHAELFPPKIYFKAAIFQQNERHTKSMCLNLKNVCFH